MHEFFDIQKRLEFSFAMDTKLLHQVIMYLYMSVSYGYISVTQFVHVYKLYICFCTFLLGWIRLF